MHQSFSMFVGVNNDGDVHISCETRVTSSRYSEASDKATFDIFLTKRRQHLRCCRNESHVNRTRPGASMGRFVIQSLSNCSTDSSLMSGDSRRIWARFIARPSRYISSTTASDLCTSQFYPFNGESMPALQEDYSMRKPEIARAITNC